MTTNTAPLPPAARTRLLHLDDVPALTALLRSNREHLAPWEPQRTDAYFTEVHQEAVVGRLLEGYRAGTTVPLVVVGDDGSVAGRLDLHGVTRGAFESASIGYWIDGAQTGRGLATSAVADAIALAFGELGLHRLQAETLVSNERSRRVLAKNGFQPFGLAPRYLRIAGRWQDHVLYQVLADDVGDGQDSPPAPGRRR